MMKKLISVILSTLILSTALTACGGSPDPGTPAGSANGGDKDAYKIAIVQPMSHTSLDQIRDTIVAELGSSGQNITGGSNNIPSAEIVKLIFNFQPDCQKIGFLYTSSEANSVSTIAAAKDYCDGEGIAYEEVSIANLSELQTAAETLISRGVDALYTGNDNSIASGMATYTDAAYAAGIPVYCGADSMVADGGFATIGVNYVQLGRQAADMALKIVDGTAPADLPYETLSDYARFVNLQAASRFGADFPESAYEGYEVLVEADGTSHFGQ